MKNTDLPELPDGDMSKIKLFARPLKDFVMAVGPSFFILVVACSLVYKYVNPAPPRHFIISSGDGEGDYLTYAKLYKDLLKEDGVDLEIRTSTGAVENLKRLEDKKSDVDVGFVHDGLGSTEEAPDVSSLGSLYYEPIWIFYRGKKELNRFSEFEGKKIAVGEAGAGTQALTLRLLNASGINAKNTSLLSIGNQAAVDALLKDQVDAAVFLATPEDAIIQNLVQNKSVRLMSVDQAEAITRQVPFLHHLVLPHGALDLKKNIPEHDVDLVAPTATLLVRDSLHPALIYLLLKAASQVHGDPGIFETKNEFPIDKDYQFPLAEEAKTFYKSGLPFWQRYLPFWIATLVDRFILLVIPLMALIIPVAKLVPKILEWRVKSRIYQRYGELKFLETQMRPGTHHELYGEYLEKLDAIEERVNHMKVPLDFSDHLYVLREHIHFVRERLERVVTKGQRTT